MPHLISLTILAVGVILMGLTPSPAHKITQTAQGTIASSTPQTVQIQADKKQEIKIQPKTVGTKTKSSTVVPEPVVQQAENIELKIAKCKADKESFYDSATAKLDKTTNDRLQEVFDSLTLQYRNTTNQIYKNRDANISRIMDDPTLTGSSKLALSAQYSDDADKQIAITYQNQQSYWLKQKADIETAKQQALNKISSLLSDEYSKCLGS